MSPLQRAPPVCEGWWKSLPAFWEASSWPRSGGAWLLSRASPPFHLYLNLSLPLKIRAPWYMLCNFLPVDLTLIRIYDFNYLFTLGSFSYSGRTLEVYVSCFFHFRALTDEVLELYLFTNRSISGKCEGSQPQGKPGLLLDPKSGQNFSLRCYSLVSTYIGLKCSIHIARHDRGLFGKILTTNHMSANKAFLG